MTKPAHPHGYKEFGNAATRLSDKDLRDVIEGNNPLTGEGMTIKHRIRKATHPHPLIAQHRNYMFGMHPTDAVKPDASTGFDFPTTKLGSSSWLGNDGLPVNILYDPATGANGLACAQNALKGINDLMSYCDAVFGVKGMGGNVIIAAVNGATNGTGGAYHYGCSFGAAGGDWYEDVSQDAVETFGLVMAEVCESYMGLQNKGWNCGGSGGEGLSRFLAEIVSGGPNGSLGAFSSGASWDGTDWISRDQGTDQDYPSIGCAVLYCWWMTKLGYTVAQIVGAGEPDGTLASNYAALTGKPATQAFQDFKAAVAAVGGPGGFQGDNPFNAPIPPWPPSAPPPPPPPGNVTVPNVVGLSWSAAKVLFQSAGLVIAPATVADPNVLVVSEAPPAGASVTNGSTVTVTLAGSPPPPPPPPPTGPTLAQVEVPDDWVFGVMSKQIPFLKKYYAQADAALKAKHAALYAGTGKHEEPDPETWLTPDIAAWIKSAPAPKN
jgi:hypothetical protein